jgi:hypothetical protein
MKVKEHLLELPVGMIHGQRYHLTVVSTDKERLVAEYLTAAAFWERKLENTTGLAHSSAQCEAFCNAKLV